MNPEPNSPSATTSADADPTAAGRAPEAGAVAGAHSSTASRALVLVLGVLVLLALLLSVLLWQRLTSIQEQLARQSADSGAHALEARTLARQAQEQAHEAVVRLAVAEARLSEVALQRSQIEELMQSLSRSRDENLVVDIESAIRLALQQAQLTGSVEPLRAALKTAEQRVARAAQPRLANLQRAIVRDLGRINASTVSDTPALLHQLDELVNLADGLPLVNEVAKAGTAGSLKPQRDDSVASWWLRSLQVAADDLRALVRVSRIESPEAVLLTPEQSFFLRENLKLKLLNARLGLLARQLDAARADLASAALAVNRYFDPASRKTQTAAALLKQMQQQMKTLELPRVDDTLAALTTAAAGR